ncbi:Myb/SANT-like domain-containing protein [Artemisia annua]|uniref:Myb/SANT-like domain-containing protein n=1 Tax=Artemisia annua TaxID=35608 RepID=A0A2U1L6S8_ARTAN|nr:Myb/SANT-like domain-containing protein [Artemisia annua]
MFSGALDGTLIKVTPLSDEKSRYRPRKGCISTNILGVCCPNMQFIYVLPGWKGSAHDNHVLRDAISRPQDFHVQMATTTCDRGRGKNKLYWNEDEVEVLVDVLQELACDPLWKVDGGFKNNYMVETHKNANGLWNFKFPYLNEVSVLPGTQNSPAVPSTSNTKKNKKLSPPTETSHKKKKSLTLKQTIDAKLEAFSSDFKSVCGQMASKIGVVADALTVDANKFESGWRGGRLYAHRKFNREHIRKSNATVKASETVLRSIPTARNPSKSHGKCTNDTVVCTIPYYGEIKAATCVGLGCAGTNDVVVCAPANYQQQPIQGMRDDMHRNTTTLAKGAHKAAGTCLGDATLEGTNAEAENAHVLQEYFLGKRMSPGNEAVRKASQNRYMNHFHVQMATTTCDRGRGKNKLYWNEDEVEVLVDVLQELSCDPLWKVDGGFKNNYMVEVRKRMAQKTTNFDKEVNPHIDSKIKYLRNKYNPLSEMLM